MLDQWMKRREKEGNDKPAPTNTGARIWDMLCNHFFKLLWANILCVSCSLLIVTIPASLCGLFAVIQQYYRKGYGDVTDTFFKEFRQNFFVRIGYTVMIMVLPLLGLLAGSLINSWTALVACSLFTVAALLILSWMYVQMSLLTLKPTQALKNALLLTALESKRDLLLILVWVVFGGSIVTFWPISMLSLLVLVPILPIIFIHVITEPVLEERIIGKDKED